MTGYQQISRVLGANWTTGLADQPTGLNSDINHLIEQAADLPCVEVDQVDLGILWYILQEAFELLKLDEKLSGTKPSMCQVIRVQDWSEPEKRSADGGYAEWYVKTIGDHSQT